MEKKREKLAWGIPYSYSKTKRLFTPGMTWSGFEEINHPPYCLGSGCLLFVFKHQEAAVNKYCLQNPLGKSSSFGGR